MIRLTNGYGKLMVKFICKNLQAIPTGFFFHIVFVFGPSYHPTVGQVHGHLINWIISGDQDQGTGASLAAKANWALIQDTMALGIDTSLSNPSHPQGDPTASRKGSVKEKGCQNGLEMRGSKLETWANSKVWLVNKKWNVHCQDHTYLSLITTISIEHCRSFPSNDRENMCRHPAPCPNAPLTVSDQIPPCTDRNGQVQM